MADQRGQQDEVWDDSVLLDSWNEALGEYKKYHSLAAKGEKVNIAAERLLQTSKSDAETQLEVAAEPSSTLPGPAAPTITNGDVSKTAAPTVPQPAPGPSGNNTIAIPQALMATVQNDDMKNLMMSWYYAGYYTGLFEGKQQGYASAQQRQDVG